MQRQKQRQTEKANAGFESERKTAHEALAQSTQDTLKGPPGPTNSSEHDSRGRVALKSKSMII